MCAAIVHSTHLTTVHNDARGDFVARKCIAPDRPSATRTSGGVASQAQNTPAHQSSATISGRARRHPLRTLHAPLKRRYIYRFLVPEQLGTFLGSSSFWVKSLVDEEGSQGERSRLRENVFLVAPRPVGTTSLLNAGSSQFSRLTRSMGR